MAGIILSCPQLNLVIRASRERGGRGMPWPQVPLGCTPPLWKSLLRHLQAQLVAQMLGPGSPVNSWSDGCSPLDELGPMAPPETHGTAVAGSIL